MATPCGAQSALPLTLMMPVLSTSSVGLVFRKNAYCAPGGLGQTMEMYVSPVVTRVHVCVAQPGTGRRHAAAFRHGGLCVWQDKVCMAVKNALHGSAHLVSTGVRVQRVSGRVLVQLHPAHEGAAHVRENWRSGCSDALTLYFALALHCTPFVLQANLQLEVAKSHQPPTSAC